MSKGRKEKRQSPTVTDWIIAICTVISTIAVIIELLLK